MPPLVAAAAVTAAGGIGGGVIAAKSAGSAAKRQAQATNRAAELESASTDKALAFQKEQAARDEARYEASQRANYNQYVSRVKAAQGLGRELGFNIPDAAPYESSLLGAGGNTTGAMPAVSADKGDIGQQVSAYFKSRGVSDQETPYWVEKWSEFGAKDPAYFNQRLAAADVFSGGAMPGRSVAAAMPGRSMAVPTPDAGNFRLRSINAFLR